MGGREDGVRTSVDSDEGTTLLLGVIIDTGGAAPGDVCRSTPAVAVGFGITLVEGNVGGVDIS